MSIESLSLEITEPGGAAITQAITGVAVSERKDLSAHLVATCVDEQGGTFDCTMNGAEIFLEVIDIKRDYTRGIVTASGVCRNTLITADGEDNAFSFEAGTRAIFTGFDADDNPHFSDIELVVGATRVKVKDTEGAWKTPSTNTYVGVAPEPGEPQSFHWFQPKDFVIPKKLEQQLLLTDADNLIGAFFVEGAVFGLFDEFKNLVIGWGKDDSEHHMEPGTDQVSVSPVSGGTGTWGEAPWQKISYDYTGSGDRYKVMSFVTDEGSYVGYDAEDYFYGTLSYRICVQNSGGGFCDVASIDNSTPDWVLFTKPPAWDDQGYEHGYVPRSEIFNEASWHTSPGQPLRFQPSGKPLLLRVEPVVSDDDSQPHQHIISQDNPVTTRIWVSGPTNTPRSVRQTREGPDDPFVYPEVEDVEICTGSLTTTKTFVQGDPYCDEQECFDELIEDPDCEHIVGEECPFITVTTCNCISWVTPPPRPVYPVSGECNTLWTGEATLDTWTDSYGHLGIDQLVGVPLPVFGITKAPAEPGWYTIVVETTDPRLATFTAQNRKWASTAFKVEGVRFLDENYLPKERFNTENNSTQAILEVYSSDGNNPEGVTVSSVGQDGASISVDVPLIFQRAGVSGKFYASITPVSEKCPAELCFPAKSTQGPRVDVGLGEARMLAKKDGQELVAAQTVFPGKFAMKFMNRDGSTLSPGSDPGAVQWTEIGDETNSYAEDVWIQISVVNPYDESQVRDFDGHAGLDEKENILFDENTRRFYDGEHGTKIDPSGNGLVDGQLISLSSGVGRQKLRSVITSRIFSSEEIEVPFNPPYSNDKAATILVVPEDPHTERSPDASDEFRIAHWVDEREYLRRREQSNLEWGASFGINGVTDWLEKRIFDIVTTFPDDGTGQVSESFTRIQHVCEESIASNAPAWVVMQDPETMHFVTATPRFRLPDDPNTFSNVSYYYGLAHHDFYDRLKTTVLHESRHVWQAFLRTFGVVDNDNDFLPASTAGWQYAEELVDAPYSQAGGGNPDGHFSGDDYSDDATPVHERNAIRFQQRLLNLDLERAPVAINGVCQTDCVLELSGAYDEERTFVVEAFYPNVTENQAARGIGLRVNTCASGDSDLCGPCDTMISYGAQPGAWEHELFLTTKKLNEEDLTARVWFEIMFGEDECELRIEVLPFMFPQDNLDLPKIEYPINPAQ